jgi:energy-coupling factor transporter ATP-binding protein EcfA2
MAVPVDAQLSAARWLVYDAAMVEAVVRWRSLVQQFRPDVPPADMSLYVRPSLSCAEDIERDLFIDHTACMKFLLVGSRGGGKSTELRAISGLLRKSFTLAEIDLDQSGVTASTVSAYDLVYIAALALLKHLPSSEGARLFNDLATSYAGSERRNELGELAAALEGLAGFTGKLAVASAASGLLSGAAPVLAGGAGAIEATGTALRLVTGSGVVAETSPRGREIQKISNEIVAAVRTATSRPICVLIDGLEKINGESGDRFREVFEQTRLLADARWSAVIAAPPCTLTETNCVDGRGFATKPVWGFGPDDVTHVTDLIRRRFAQANVGQADIDDDGLAKIARASGGLPRHAVMATRAAILAAARDEAENLTEKHVESGISTLADSLGRGLNAVHIEQLAAVMSSGLLPGSHDAATLFADGRILASAPKPPSRMPVFHVHPLLRQDVSSRLPA